MTYTSRCAVMFFLGAILWLQAACSGQAQPATTTAATVLQTTTTTAADPGVRTGAVNAGGPLAHLTPAQMQAFQDGQRRFGQPTSVAGTVIGEPGIGLGPTFNGNSCGSCHAQPAPGGSSPSANAFPNLGPNPQVTLANLDGATNAVPSFISLGGPVREARFPFTVANGAVTATADGGVHDLYTIAGRSDAGGCTLAQPDFPTMEALNNVIFRIPTPVYGSGLIEGISDATIAANAAANAALKAQLGISGHANTSGNDGSITRFGWKAQNKLTIFSGEAYNVEMGVTNEVFPNERGAAAGNCALNPTPEDTTNLAATGPQENSDITAFTTYMRFLAPPAPSSAGIPGSPGAQSIANGQAIFSQIHCDLCHTPAMSTGNTSYAALSNQTANLYSDLLLHHMGAGLSDQIAQGASAPDEFRTAPLWGLGQRVFFLHDGRSTPANGGLVNAIQQHAGNGSEANAELALFNALSAANMQDLLNFLRSL